jgi:hypothetical protein
VVVGGVTRHWVRKRVFCQLSANIKHIIKFPEKWQKIQPFHPLQGRNICQFSENRIIIFRSHPPNLQRTANYLNIFRKVAKNLPFFQLKVRLLAFNEV